MRGTTVKFLRRVSLKFQDAGHPVSWKKLKKRWIETGRDKRHAMIKALMRQGNVYD